MKQHSHGPRAVLVRTRRLGDTLALTPAICALGDAGIATWLIYNKAYSCLYQSLPYNFRRSEVSDKFSTWQGIRLGIALRKHHPTHFLCMQGTSSGMAAAAVLCGASSRVAFADNRVKNRAKARVFNHLALREDLEDCHICPANVRIISRSLGLELPTGPMQIWAYASQVERALPEGLPTGDYVVLHVGTGGSNLALPAEAYKSIGDLIARTLGVTVVLTGGVPGSGEIRGPHYCDLRAQTGLPSLIGVLERGLALISVDCGVTHLAGALGIPVVDIFPRLCISPEKYYPWMSRHRVVTPRLHCSPCSPGQCSGNGDRCATSVDPGDVMAALGQLLGS